MIRLPKPRKTFTKFGNDKKKTNWQAPRITEATIRQNEAAIRAYDKEIEKLRAEVAFFKSVIASGGYTLPCQK